MSTPPKRRIGFVDFQLENFHANVFLGAIRDKLADRGYEVAGCHGTDVANGRAWAEKNRVPFFDTAEALNERVDCFMVLAPSNPETHLELCQRVFPFGKPTYVDKTFAPDLATAQAIYRLADQHGVAVQTSSALRYTNVQAHARASGNGGRVEHIVAWCPGRAFDEYAVHAAEMAVSCMGPDVATLMRRGTDPYSQVLINFADGRTATLNVYTTPGTPYAAAVTTADGTKYVPVETATLFLDTARAILDFFDAGKPAIDRAESLAIRRILDAAQRPEARSGFVSI